MLLGEVRLLIDYVVLSWLYCDTNHVRWAGLVSAVQQYESTRLVMNSFAVPHCCTIQIDTLTMYIGVLSLCGSNGTPAQA